MLLLLGWWYRMDLLNSGGKLGMGKKGGWCLGLRGWLFRLRRGLGAGVI